MRSFFVVAALLSLFQAVHMAAAAPQDRDVTHADVNEAGVHANEDLHARQEVSSDISSFFSAWSESTSASNSGTTTSSDFEASTETSASPALITTSSAVSESFAPLSSQANVVAVGGGGVHGDA